METSGRQSEDHLPVTSLWQVRDIDRVTGNLLLLRI